LRNVERLPALPLRVVHDLRAVEAAVSVGGDEAGQVTHHFIGCPLPELNEALLVLGLDGEDVDQSRQRRISADDRFRAALLDSSSPS